MKAMVFYSWQSDTPAASNRTLIQGALETAVIDIARDGSVGVEPVVDRDTEKWPAPQILFQSTLEIRTYVAILR